jgi:hypothetical protein
MCGASEMVGAATLAQACRRLHAAAAAGTAPHIRSAFALLEDAVRVLNQHLESP